MLIGQAQGACPDRAKAQAFVTGPANTQCSSGSSLRRVHTANMKCSSGKRSENCTSFSICCASLTWWLWRGGCTRSHSEHGRETPQRLWYFVLRRGRVGRCQVCQAQQQIFSSHSRPKPKTSGRASGLLLLVVRTYRMKLRRTWRIMVRPLQEQNPMGFAPVEGITAKRLRRRAKTHRVLRWTRGGAAR